jgi:hypothetical protein
MTDRCRHRRAGYGRPRTTLSGMRCSHTPVSGCGLAHRRGQGRPDAQSGRLRHEVRRRRGSKGRLPVYQVPSPPVSPRVARVARVTYVACVHRVGRSSPSLLSGCRVQATWSVRPAPPGSRPDWARERRVSVKAAALGVGPRRGTRSASGGPGLDGAPPRARVGGSRRGSSEQCAVRWAAKRTSGRGAEGGSNAARGVRQRPTSLQIALPVHGRNSSNASVLGAAGGGTPPAPCPYQLELPYSTGRPCREGRTGVTRPSSNT